MTTVEPAHDDQPAHDPDAPPPHAPEPPREPANPAVALLKGMFPDFDDLVIQSVLESVGGNQDAAIDVLLGMSDPSYVSHQQTPQPTAPQSTLELDEALARQLQLEDDRQSAEHQQRPRGQSWRPRRNSEEPSQQQQQSPGQSAQGTGVGPDLNEIKETLNQMAESGKRTFSSIVSRAKAKINEYQQARPGAQQQAQPDPQQHPPPSWGATPVQGTPSSAASFPNYYHETQQPVDRHTASQAYARYYTPAGDSPDLGLDDGWQQISRRGRRSDEKPLEQPAHEAKGYDLDTPDLSTTGPSTVPSAAVSAANTPAVPPSGPAAHAAISEPEPTIPSAPSPPSEVPRPPATQAGSPLNAAKFGLLPKRPVSLLTPQASGAQPVAREASVSEDDEDELDYVENPFEEHKH